MTNPSDGGCWYCHVDDDKLTFCYEFDTFIHVSCIKRQLACAEGKPDRELEIIAREFGLMQEK